MKRMLRSITAKTIINNNPPVQYILPETLIGILTAIPELKKYNIELFENDDGTMRLIVGNMIYDLYV